MKPEEMHRGQSVEIYPVIVTEQGLNKGNELEPRLFESSIHETISFQFFSVNPAIQIFHPL